MSVVIYTVNIVYICVFMTCSTSFPLCDIYGSMECVYVCYGNWMHSFSGSVSYNRIFLKESVHSDRTGRWTEVACAETFGAMYKELGSPPKVAVTNRLFYSYFLWVVLQLTAFTAICVRGWLCLQHGVYRDVRLCIHVADG